MVIGSCLNKSRKRSIALWKQSGEIDFPGQTSAII